MSFIVNIVKSNKVIVLLDQFLYSGSNFIITLFLARILSTSDFGIYSIVLLSILLIISLGSAIIIQPFQVANAKRQKSKIYANFLFYSQSAFLTIVTILVYIIYKIMRVNDYSFLALTVIMIGTIFHDYFRKFYLVKHELNNVLMIDLIVTVCQGIVMLYLVYNKISNLNTIFILIGLCYIIAVIYSTYKLKPIFIKTVFWFQLYTYHIKQGLWLILVAFIQWASSNLFIISSGIFISKEALGAFRLVQSLFGILSVVFQTFENFVLPNASRILSTSIAGSRDYIKKISLQSSILIAIILGILFILSKEVMYLFTGANYLNYSYVIKGMCILYFIIFIGYPVRLSIRMLLLNKSFFTGYLLSFIFSVLFFNYLLKYWQLNGVIIGLIINQLIMILFWNYQLTKKNFYLWK